MSQSEKTILVIVSPEGVKLEKTATIEELILNIVKVIDLPKPLGIYVSEGE